MKIGIPKETVQGETRVALVPGNISALTRDKHEVFVESGAGLGASISDEAFGNAGATNIGGATKVYDQVDVVFKVQPPTPQEAGMMKEGSVYIGFLAPLSRAATLDVFCKRRITGFSMEYVPRITRAQSMDALWAMARVAGYKAVLLATEKLGKMFPLLMTAAGTVPPAIVLILGAGVAGLQAIATAKRLGAKVEAFDPRPAVIDQVKSLGATFIEMEMPKDAETAGGYAKELSPEFIKKEWETISARLPKVDVVITTAQVFGKRAPTLITADMVNLLRPGAVIVDLAAEQGGNCELTEAGKTVERHSVTIMGPINLAAALPTDASLMYSKTIVNLFKLLYPKADALPDFNDEIVKGACITRDGQIVNESVRSAIRRGTN
ncbi:MAG: Re/Si-specific NAD(P)(+) transhydrogenase subunit alpha [Bacteroidota bacterium]